MEKANKVITKVSNGYLVVNDGKTIRIMPEKEYRRNHNHVKITQHDRTK